MQLSQHENNQLTPEQIRFNKMASYCYVCFGITATLTFLLIGLNDYYVMVMAAAGFFSAYTAANSQRGGKSSFVLAIGVVALCTIMLSFFWGYNLYIALLPLSAIEIAGGFVAWRKFSV